jgi:hypothetical protein
MLPVPALTHAGECEEQRSNSSCIGAALISLPVLLPGYVPDLGYLPALVLALARDVNWDAERPCFHGLAQVCTVHGTACVTLCQLPVAECS